MALDIHPAQAVLSLVWASMDVKSLSSLSEIWALLSLCSHTLSRSSDSLLALLLVILLAVVVEWLRGEGGVLQTLGSPRDPDSTGSSAGSKSVERCEGMVAVVVAEDAEADEVEAEAVMVDAEVEEAELAGAAVADADVVEAGLS